MSISKIFGFRNSAKLALVVGFSAALMFSVYSDSGGAGTVTIDGQSYRTVRIGGRTWMAENLSAVPKNISRGAWHGCYGDDEYNCDKYGRLYSWDAATNACPAGWRLPTKKDWDDLAKVAGGKGKAGISLKSTAGWANNNGTDSFGFSALPGGFRTPSRQFIGISEFGYWWTSEGYTDGRAQQQYMASGSGLQNRVGGRLVDKSCGSSVRCVQN